MVQMKREISKLNRALQQKNKDSMPPPSAGTGENFAQRQWLTLRFVAVALRGSPDRALVGLAGSAWTSNNWIRESRAMPRAYFRGLNFLMNEEPDKAVEAFIDVSKAHPEAVELQFALGSLLRRRGEADRAINSSIGN